MRVRYPFRALAQRALQAIDSYTGGSTREALFVVQGTCCKSGPVCKFAHGILSGTGFDLLFVDGFCIDSCVCI